MKNKYCALTVACLLIGLGIGSQAFAADNPPPKTVASSVDLKGAVQAALTAGKFCRNINEELKKHMKPGTRGKSFFCYDDVELLKKSLSGLRIYAAEPNRQKSNNISAISDRNTSIEGCSPEHKRIIAATILYDATQDCIYDAFSTTSQAKDEDCKCKPK